MNRTAWRLVWLLAAALTGSDAWASGGSPTWVQEHYRWRNDNGSESTAVWMAAADAAVTGQARYQNIRLRFVVSNTGSASGTVTPRLEFAPSTTGSWSAVSTETNGATAFEMTTTPGYADGDASTAQMTGTGAWVSGKVMEKPSNMPTNALTINTNSHTEVEYCFRATAKASGSATYYFRLSNGGTALTTYSRTAQLTMAAGEANEPPVIAGPLAAQTSTQMTMSYPVTASGTEPVTYGAGNLPAGLLFDGTNRIIGRSTSPGTFNIGLSASNAWGSDAKTLVLTVLDNIAPVASNQAVTARAGGEVQFSLAWGDLDTPAKTAHTFTIVSNPSHGRLQSYNERYGSTLNPDIYYLTADAGYAGSDSFTWKCSDGDKESNVGTCSITVSNTPPTASATTLGLSGGLRRALAMTYSDADGVNQPLTMTVVSLPARGVLETGAWAPVAAGTAFPAAQTLLYTSEAGFTGTDSFTWKVNDGLANSTTVTYTLNVTNFVLSAANLTVSCRKDTPLIIQVLPVGAAGYTLTKSNPSHGTLVVSGGNLVYTPTNGYVGGDSCWYNAVGGGQSPAGTISITVTANADWPQWRANECRTGVGGGSVPASLYLQWRRDVPPVTPAWAAGHYANFDRSYHPVVLGKTMFLGMNANDSLTAYDTDTGTNKWRFCSGSAIRCAPVAYSTGSGPMVAFGSDDGYVYCLNAINGVLVWKFRAGPSDRKVIGNGRLASVWPVRGGVVYRNGRLYFAAGLLTFEGIFCYCVDAETGALVWRNGEASGIIGGMPHSHGMQRAFPPQGQLTFSYNYAKLFVPAGRNMPAQLDPATGAILWWGHDGTPGAYVDGSGYPVVDEPITITSGARTYTSADATALGVAGTVGSIMAGDDKLFVATSQGSLYCFGGTQVTNPPVYLRPSAGLPNVSDSWTTAVQSMLSRDDLKQGLALVLGAGSGRLVKELAKQAPNLRIAVADPDAAKLAALRAELDAAGSSFETRVSVFAGNPLDCGFAPYQAGLIASENATVAGIGAGQSFAEYLFKCTRPFGGEVWLPTTAGQHADFAGWVAASTNMPLCEVVRNGAFTQMKRTGLTPEVLLTKPPYGILWFGQSAWQGNPSRGCA
ncbi:MAG: hypothetical protein C0404_11105, partial [Verrucomicrobia bacterium]|nr:hypothetical protein [Verrucomicrobiota bacterium]